MSLKKKEIKTLKLYGTVFQIYSDSYVILGSDRYLYWATGYLKKQLDSYSVNLSDVLKLIVIPGSRDLHCAFPEDFDDGGKFDFVTISEKV